MQYAKEPNPVTRLGLLKGFKTLVADFLDSPYF